MKEFQNGGGSVAVDYVFLLIFFKTVVPIVFDPCFAIASVEVYIPDETSALSALLVTTEVILSKKSTCTEKPVSNSNSQKYPKLVFNTNGRKYCRMSPLGAFYYTIDLH